MREHDRNNRSAGSGSKVWIFRIVGILILLGTVAGITTHRQGITQWVAEKLSLAKDEEPIALLSLEQGPLQLETQADGEIVGLESLAVSTPNTGAGSLKLAWLIPEGSMVAKSDPLIRYDSTDMSLNLETQKNTLTQNQLQSKIDVSDQQLSENSLMTDRTTAQMDYDYTMKTKPEDPMIFSQWEIINASLNADFAKSRIENLAARYNTQKRQDRSARQISAIARSKAQTEVNILEQAFSVMNVKAPAAGIVVYRRDRRQDPQIGDNCQAGQVMIDLVNLNALQARIYVLEKEASGLNKGQAVNIKLDALPDREFHGIVRSVAPLASTIERNGVLKYFTCDVTIDDAQDYLRLIKPGMTVKARVILMKYDSCFMVPSSALDYKEDQNKTFVYIKKGDAYEKREVKLGLGKHGQATILSGVSDKELIALRNPFESRKLTLPDFSKASESNQQKRGGPGGRMGMDGGGDMMIRMGGGPGGGGGGGGRGR
jgi:multidrug efflux pump subunit AcrA (membrane-fusion protein)